MTIVGSQTGADGACGKLYPARMRASGLGWALGIGRQLCAMCGVD
jgi:MFS transporter, AAHS family, 4-hydroxybenzoate transporter